MGGTNSNTRVCFRLALWFHRSSCCICICICGMFSVFIMFKQGMETCILCFIRSAMRRLKPSYVKASTPMAMESPIMAWLFAKYAATAWQIVNVRKEIKATDNNSSLEGLSSRPSPISSVGLLQHLWVPQEQSLVSFVVIPMSYSRATVSIASSEICDWMIRSWESSLSSFLLSRLSLSFSLGLS